MSSILAFVLAVSRESLVSAEVTIPISGVPDFPLPEGTNVVLTATIKGAEVRGGWLSRNRDAQARFILLPEEEE